MPSVALREGGQLASNGNKTLKGYNNNILPFVAFFACKNKRSRRRSVRRMPSVALRAGGQLASNGNKTLKGYNNNILPFVAFFAYKNKWSATERAKDAAA